MSRHEEVSPPQRTLLALLIVAVICGGLMYLIPDEGIPLTEDTRIIFATFDDFLPREDDGIIDAEAFLANYMPLLEDTEDVDDSIEVSLIDRSIAVIPPGDSSRYMLVDGAYVLKPELEVFRDRMRIRKDSAGIKNMHVFFDRLGQLPQNGGKLRVLHYGDSQIETDRISRYIRNELQKRFGGVGPGLLPPVEVVPTGAINQHADANWRRYTIFGKQDTTVKHTRFAPLGSFASYDSTSASLRFAPSKMAYGRAAKYELVSLYFANYAKDAMLEVLVADTLYSQHLLVADSIQKTLTWELSQNAGELQFSFTGGPVECYAVGFDGYSGVQIDNIPMRGSSGTIFRKIDRSQFSHRLNEHEVGLVLLQYGGNSVPYVKDSIAAENYGRWMQSQIRLIREELPQAAIVLIGPSDMAYKERDAFVTYPYLEKVRDELQKAAFATGCGYWDIYEVMGGRNSMAAWVNNDPPLAGADYIHFTPKGARRVAELFMKALFDEDQNDDTIQ